MRTLWRFTALAALCGACTRGVEPDVARPSPRVIAPQLVVTDSVNGTVTMMLRLEGLSPTLGKVGSFTARVTYDPASLEFVGEEPLTDGVLRALNPTPGLVRVAGAGVHGISETGLVALRFRVKARDGAATARATLDELHALSRTDLSDRVRPDGRTLP